MWHVAFILGCMIMFRNTLCKEGGVDIYSDLCGEGEKGESRKGLFSSSSHLLVSVSVVLPLSIDLFSFV